MVKKLVVLAGPDAGRVFNLGDDPLLLGRSRANEGHLIDPHTARVHCQVVPDGDHYALVDFESEGGTFINGLNVSRQRLQVGDLIRIGSTRLQYVEDMDAASPASAAVPAASDWPRDVEGQTVSHFEIGARLARGKMGFLFHARDTRNDTAVALKIIRPDLTDSDTKVKHFVDAMKATLPLKHPHLLRILGAGKSGAHCWIATEYVPGDSLAAVIGRIERVGRIDWRTVLRIGLALSRGLEYAHDKGLIHQNVSPANVLVGKTSSDVKLTDLAVASAIGEDPLAPISAAGTPSEALAYLAPERTDGPEVQVDVRADLYSLGACLLALFSGKPPFQADTVEEMVEKIRLEGVPRLHTLHAEVPDALGRLLLRLLAKRVQDRPKDAAALRKELEAIARANQVAH